MQIFVLSSSRIQQRGYDTLFNYTTANPKSGVSKFVKKFPLKRQVCTVVPPSVPPGCYFSPCPCPACPCLAVLFSLVPSPPAYLNDCRACFALLPLTVVAPGCCPLVCKYLKVLTPSCAQKQSIFLCCVPAAASLHGITCHIDWNDVRGL